MEKLRVGVLMGGRSIEKEVSFNSGRTVCDHLDTARYTVIPLFQSSDGALYVLPDHFLHRGKISDFEARLAHEAQKIAWDDLKKQIDFMYIAMNGRFGEDGILQGLLEVLAIPYLGSGIFASALGMDKAKQKIILENSGISVANSIIVTPQQIDDFENQKKSIFQQLQEKNISFSAVVKPSQEGSSLGVTVVHDAGNLYAALKTASSIYPVKRQDVLIEEKIKGMEFSCIVLTDYTTGKPFALPPTEIVPNRSDIFDYDQKYMPGQAIEYTPARTSADNNLLIQQTCIATMKALGFKNGCRIDGFLTPDNKVVIIDPNSLSGMAPASFMFREAVELNMSHTHVINHLIQTELALQNICTQATKEEIMMQKDSNKKIRVGVLLGGPSNEREISLESGRNVCYKLSPHKYDVIPLFVSQSNSLYHINQKLLVRNSTQEIATLIEPSMQLKWNDLAHVCDFVFIALHGGIGENGAVQGMLEMLGLPYNGSGVLTSALCMDKYKTTQFLKSYGFDVPHALLLAKEQWRDNKNESLTTIKNTFTLPCIVKPHDDGCSVMVEKVHTIHELEQAVEAIFTNNKEYTLIEEFIVGMELTVGVIGNNNPKALPPSQAIAQAGVLSIKEKFLPGTGENQTPAPLPASTLRFVQNSIEQVYKAVGCKGYARIDCFYQNEKQSPTGQSRVVIIEINTLPGLTPATCIFHQAAELSIKPMDFIDQIVQLGFEEHTNVVASSQAKQSQLER